MIPLTGPRVKDLLQGSRLARRGYAIAMNAAAAGFGASGNLLSEMHYRMRAVRADIGYSDPTRTARRLRRPLLSRLFGAPALGELAENRLLAAYVQSPEAERHRRFWRQFPCEAQVRMRFPREGDDPERMGDLVILKSARSAADERGVLLISFTERIREFAAVFDLPAITAHYQLVLQPSSWGYPDTTFLFYVGSDADILVQSPWSADHDFVQGLDMNLRATSLGAGDWIDPALFCPDTAPREYDIVMVSSWSPIKRHQDLFRTLAQLRSRGRPLRALLIGYPSDWTRTRIESLARRYRVLDLCTIVESVPHAEVARLVSRSRAYVLLSRREGANRALYEALFCDTPVIVYRTHHGVNLHHITDDTGATFEPHQLADVILRVVDRHESFRPREWAISHTGYKNATSLMNERLRAMTSERNRSWSTDIVETKMAPTLRYAQPGQYRDFAREYDDLTAFLIDT